jgi:hypothetical protein
MDRLKWLTAGVVFVAVWSVFIVFSVRAYWRTSNDERKARYYSGAKFWGLFETIGAALVLPSVVPFWRLPYEVQALFWAFLFFPGALPVGYYVAWFTDALNDRFSKK